MSTLSALPHNTASKFGRAERLYPIGLCLRAERMPIAAAFVCIPEIFQLLGSDLWCSR